MTQKTNLRQTFLKFFETRGHTLVPSDSLVPSSDPTLLFTSAGMVQFKPHFLQQIPLAFTRAASSQRCLRTTDIDEVGRTPRHLTLFEMLGNFSFGDYFKEDAIAWAWEFFTKEVGLPADRLWPTVYKDDDEAFAIWKKIVPESRIFRMGEDTNFWNMGPTGPCGPCSEIYWDFEGRSDGRGPDDSNRWMEIWNLVFTQYDRQENGELKPLPKKNIDTGMGLERLTSVVEGVEGNFETSLFAPILAAAEDRFRYKRGGDARKDTALKIYADHLRAVTLLVFDGILPSNEGRGYVLRRLLRRAVRQGSLFGVTEPFLYKGVPLITELFNETADELQKRQTAISEIVKQEEERFLETLQSGSEKLSVVVAAAKKKKLSQVPGAEVFRLYDTYGFPPELTSEILSEQGLTFEPAEFDSARVDAQSKAREGWKGSGQKDATIYNKTLKDVGASVFRGYDTLMTDGNILALLKEGKSVDALSPGETGEVITKETPFYPEGGGQVGDQGWIKTPAGEIVAVVRDAQKPAAELIVHRVEARKPLRTGETVRFQVDENHREPTMRHHTATHLLHAALRTVLGSTVTQAGSLVAPDRLRFDYTYNKPLTADQIREIEDRVNVAVLKNWEVTPKVFSSSEARRMGAMALFGEKYGDRVRCLLISAEGYEAFQKAFSLELCGGTHVSATGDIGGFKIVSDTSIAAGVRRMEAIAGTRTIEYLREIESTVRKAADRLKAAPEEIDARLQKLLDRQRKLEQEIQSLKLKAAQGGPVAGPSAIQKIGDANLACKVVDGLAPKELRLLADRELNQIKSGVVFLASSVEVDGKAKVSFVVAVTANMMAKGHNAGALAKKVAALIGGSGGGRPDFAQGGGTDPAKIALAMEKFPSFLSA